MYKLPERRGEVIWAMPERKHFFKGGVPLFEALDFIQLSQSEEIVDKQCMKQQ